MNKTNCEKCGKKLILRTGKYGKFLACPGFPKCKFTSSYHEDTIQPEEKIESLDKIVFSKYQKDIFSIVKNTDKNILVQAVAGSGKSFTLVEIVKLLDHSKKNIFLAFNRDIVKELAKKIPDYCIVKTLHSLGYSNIRKFYPKIRINQDKLNDLIAIYIDQNIELKDDIKNNFNVIIRLVNLIKDSMLDCTLESISYLSDRYSLTLNSDTEIILNAVSFLFNRSIQDTTSIDFSDMLYFCAIGLIPCEKFDNLLIDESQDLNPTQLKMMEYSMHKNSRLIAVGDRNQSIYGFRASDIESMDKIKNKFDCIELPLSICYRCQETVIKFINTEFSFIQFEGKENNQAGILDTIEISKFEKIVQDKNLVLCRNNAPLIKPAYSLLSQGKKVIIKGKEIGQNLINLIQKLSKKYQCESIIDLLESIEKYRAIESEKLERLNQTRKLDTLHDQLDCIVNFANNQDSIIDMIIQIDSIFSDNDQDGIIFSTVHKAKGLESDIVFIIQPELMPGKNAKTDWEKIQELNIKYVAYTRSKRELYLIK